VRDFEKHHRNIEEKIPSCDNVEGILTCAMETLQANVFVNIGNAGYTCICHCGTNMFLFVCKLSLLDMHKYASRISAIS